MSKRSPKLASFALEIGLRHLRVGDAGEVHAGLQRVAGECPPAGSDLEHRLARAEPALLDRPVEFPLQRGCERLVVIGVDALAVGRKDWIEEAQEEVRIGVVVGGDRLLVGIDLTEEERLDEAPGKHQRVAVIEMGSEREGLQHVAFDVDDRRADRPRRCRLRRACGAPGSPDRCEGRPEFRRRPRPGCASRRRAIRSRRALLTPPTRLIKASSVLAADDMSLSPTSRRTARRPSRPAEPGGLLADFASESSRLKWEAVAESPVACRYHRRRFDHPGDMYALSPRPLLQVFGQRILIALCLSALSWRRGQSAVRRRARRASGRPGRSSGSGRSKAAVRAAPAAPPSAFSTARPGSTASRSPVSGAIFIPPGPAPAGGRNVIAWAHPTSGVVEPCAPSLMPDLAGTIWGLRRDAGAGLRGGRHRLSRARHARHPPLSHRRERRTRGARHRCARRATCPIAGASNRFAVWGHSQGGHASLYTGELAASYAPDLKLVGVAAAAPATYLIELFDADKSSAGRQGARPPWRSIPGPSSITTRRRAWWTRRHAGVRAIGA